MKYLVFILSVVLTACETVNYSEMQNISYKNSLTLDQKISISSMPGNQIKYLSDSVLCDSSVEENNYKPNNLIIQEINRRGLECRIFRDDPKYKISDKELCMQFMTLPSVNFHQTARARAIQQRGIDCWQYGNVTEERRKADAEMYRNLQPAKPAVPQQIIIYPPSNPNACIQDGGLISCPNHPNTRLPNVFK